jgi:uncharacterized membrane protein YqjE
LSTDAPREPPGEEPGGDALDAAIARLTEIAGSLQQLFDVQVARARVEVRERVFQALGGLLLAVLLLALTVLAGGYLLRGLSGLFTAVLGNVTWAGDLAAGTAVLLVILVAGILVRARMRRVNLQRVREKFDASAAPQSESE